MKTALYVIYFVLHIPESFSQNIAECVHDLLSDVDFPGNDIESVLAPDVHYCQKVCTENSRCQFFTFLTSGWNTDNQRFYCYLKRTTTGQPSVKSNLQNVVSGYSLRDCGTQSSCFETVYDGLDFPGNDIHQSVVENEESCQRKCTEEPDCQFFTFIKEEFHNEPQRLICYRKKSERGTPARITILQNVVSGFSLRRCEGCVRELLSDVDFPGNDIESVLAPDVHYCQKVCTEDSRCQFFTFLTSGWNTDNQRFYCYLKRTTTGQPSVKSNLQNVVSGYSLRDCGTQSSCFETVYDGLDFPGNDIHQSVVENEESCQRKCTEEPDCQFFTFIKEEFHNEPQRLICYRKKSERGTPARITILQNVVSGFSLRRCEGCVRELLSDVDFPGNDIESVLAPDVHYCQKVCTEDSRCQFFTFLTSGWNTDNQRFYCYLKRTTTGQPSVKSNLQNVVSGYSLRDCGTQSSCFETVYDGLDFPGNDIHQSVVENEESCQRKCTEEPDCQFFTFIKEEFHNEPQRLICYRKKSERGTPARITILQNVVSGFSLRRCEGCVRELLSDVDFPGNDIESVLAPDVHYCQKVCTEDSRCQFFTFLTSGWNTDNQRFYCYLKRTTTGQPSVKSNLQNVVSGYSLRDCGTQSCK
ncbi:coagulation factor XI-like [Stegostoma tigrinum]|uniref:coagulation factor XI-like n=1 Tax=Stegostoma tigrinum TaxID=3053191 RepID=UPI0028700111|nr:coagulation factor XI-like [Stegostoma tigrinum]